MLILKASIVLIGLITIAGTSVAAAAPKQQTASNCYVDDGYGRKRPCSAGSVGIKRVQKVSDDCFTDDGNGRRRPCSAGGVGIKR
jgi:hypothetical protein